MNLTILFGGKAGQGPNILSQLVGEVLVEQGYHVFYSRDYQSLIRGGHNFNVLTFSDEPIFSNESKIDILVCLDEKTEELHKSKVKKNALILKGDKDNMYFAGKVFKILNLDFQVLEEKLKKLKNFDANFMHASEGYKQEKNSIKLAKPSLNEKNFYFQNGTQGLVDGSLKAGLDIYYAYPMTPATPFLFELSPKQIEKNVLSIELESEVAVINAAIGSAATGAKAIIGTSGGGFDLMTEGLSFASQAEIPLVIYLASRPGPGTGVATYTSQGDLHLARHAGHGDAFRLVLCPGDPKEAAELASQAFYFSQKYKLPVIILSDKHLGESLYTLNEQPKITKSDKTVELIRFNSYEHDKNGNATENEEIIKQGFERRAKKQKDIEKEASKFTQYKVYGRKDSKNIILSYGSTKGAILDSIKDIDCKFIQILYAEPFPDILQEIKNAKNLILIENSSTSQLSDILAEKLLIKIEDKNKILKYDGRPFLHDELKEEIKRRLK